MHKFAKNFLKIFAGILVCLVLVAAAFCVWVADKYVVPIITYHSVNDIANLSCPTVHVDNFRRQMDFLKRQGFHVLTLEELVEGTKQGKSFARKSIVITFDDGMEDNYTNAYPILKEYNFPATMFVSSHFIDLEGYMTWNQLREMSENNITIGSHSRYHKHIPDLSPEAQYEAIFESKKHIEVKLGRRVDYIAYPFGGFSDHVLQLVKDAGYKGACTTNRGRDRFNRDVYELNRVRLSNKKYDDMSLWIKFSGYFNFFRTLEKPH